GRRATAAARGTRRRSTAPAPSPQRRQCTDPSTRRGRDASISSTKLSDVSLGETVYQGVNWVVNGKSDPQSEPGVSDTVITKNMEYDVIALGETMLALAPPRERSLRDAEALLVDHAGAESNTCVGLARLGLRVAWISRLGADAAGDRILDALGAEGIDTRWVRRDPLRPTGLMVKEPAGVRYYRTASAASVLAPADLDAVPVAEARAVLVSGVTALLGPHPHAAGLALLERARGLRIVDPNLRHGLWGSDRRRELVMPYVERCDLLFAGSQELVELFGDPTKDLEH